MVLNCMGFDARRQKSEQAHLNDNAEVINVLPGGGGGWGESTSRVIG